MGKGRAGGADGTAMKCLKDRVASSVVAQIAVGAGIAAVPLLGGGVMIWLNVNSTFGGKVATLLVLISALVLGAGVSQAVVVRTSRMLRRLDA